MKTVIPASVTLLALLCLPAVAGTPRGSHKPVAAPATVADALTQMAGKKQILGITETNGTRFLGRVTSGDHGLYVVQTFHFAGPPTVTTQATTQTVGSGRRRRTTRRTTHLSTDTTIPDDQAVRLLLSGVAGTDLNPREIAGPRLILAPADVKFVQTLTPPVTPQATKGTAGSSVVASPTAARQLGWTLTSLWPPASAEAVKP